MDGWFIGYFFNWYKHTPAGRIKFNLESALSQKTFNLTPFKKAIQTDVLRPAFQIEQNQNKNTMWMKFVLRKIEITAMCGMQLIINTIMYWEKIINLRNKFRMFF